MKHYRAVEKRMGWIHSTPDTDIEDLQDMLRKKYKMKKCVNNTIIYILNDIDMLRYTYKH